MTSKPSRINPTVDLTADGKRHGYLNVPWSRNESAWGAVRVPITVVCNGDGPTVLLVAGNHGDEYEGQIALLRLARELRPEQVAGRVVILPALNLPAVRAGTRVSPIDGGNMNRSFPGRRDGTVTAMIAHYVHTELLPSADVVLDLHSGGKTLNFVPSTLVHELPDRDQMRRTLDAARAFAAPAALVLVELDSEGMLDTVAEEMGKVFVGTELGGAGGSTPTMVAVAETGVRNVLRHIGVLDGEPESREARGLEPTRLMHTPDPSCFIVAEGAGLGEFLVELGDAVVEGDPVAVVHDFEAPGREPVVYRAARSGMLWARHWPGLVGSGDCLAVIAVDHGAG